MPPRARRISHLVVLPAHLTSCHLFVPCCFVVTEERVLESVVVKSASAVAFGRIFSRSESTGDVMHGMGAQDGCEQRRDVVVGSYQSFFGRTTVNIDQVQTGTIKKICRKARELLHKTSILLLFYSFRVGLCLQLILYLLYGIHESFL